MLNCSPCPCLIPGPHLAGSVQVLTPFGVTFHPWLDSRLLALVGLYWYGEPAFSCGDRKWVTGVLPTGPGVCVPYPRSGPLMTAAWFSRYASDCRKYNCWMIGPFPVLDWKFITK
jgi:hypothetical protein